MYNEYFERVQADLESDRLENTALAILFVVISAFDLLFL